MLLFFFSFIYTDNIEISTSDFDILLIGNTFLLPRSNKDKGIDNEDKGIDNKDWEIINIPSTCNSIKISFPGTSLYNLIEIQERQFYLKNSTVYFPNSFNSKSVKSFIRIDFEYKFYGLIFDTWILILIMSWISYYSIFNKRNNLIK